jgi:hypothetical protein
MKRKTTEEFIQQAIGVHNGKYDYSKTKYSNNQTHVEVICPDHGSFWVTPANHLKRMRGRGCPKCAGRHKTNQEFISKSILIHGDKYDYSKANYAGSDSKIDIICRTHGVFQQRPHSHWRGSGCPKCAGRHQTTEYFIEEAKQVHGDRYDYSESVYLSAKDKIKIICPIHGMFEQQPNNHLMGKGCNQCGIDKTANTHRKTQEEFIKEARRAHGDKYDYSESVYLSLFKKIKITCPIHGQFEQIPSSHLKGCGCQKCGYESLSATKTKTTEQFIQEARQIHGDKYDYSNVKYVDSQSKITIICPTHGIFKQQPNSHLSGCSCPNCADYGFNPEKPSLIYLLKFQTDIATFWKIGITNRTIEKRFTINDFNCIRLGFVWKCKGNQAYKIEQCILKTYRQYQLRFLFPLIEGTGNTECLDLNLPFKKVVKEITDKIKSPPKKIKGGL